MKNKLKIKTVYIAFLVAGILGISVPSLAECNAGKTLSLGSEREFCISKIDMTWWAAFTWCEANHLHLASWQEACPEKDEPTPGYTSSCSDLGAELRRLGYANNTFWTTLTRNTNQAVSIGGNGGTSSHNSRSSARRALCVMN